MSGICDCITAYKLTDVLSKATRLKRMQQVLMDGCHGETSPDEPGKPCAMRHELLPHPFTHTLHVCVLHLLYVLPTTPGLAWQIMPAKRDVLAIIVVHPDVCLAVSTKFAQLCRSLSCVMYMFSQHLLTSGWLSLACLLLPVLLTCRRHQTDILVSLGMQSMQFSVSIAKAVIFSDPLRRSV